MFHLGSDLNLVFREYITFLGNILDVAVVENKRMIIYSLDNFHVPFSTAVIADKDQQTTMATIGSLTLDRSGRWRQRDIMRNIVARIGSDATKDAGYMKQGQSLSSLLYGVENLRKRGQEEPE